jgi:hypothetical protein
MTSKTMISSCTAVLGVAAAFRGSPGESGDAAEPARQLFPDDHVFVRIEGLIKIAPSIKRGFWDSDLLQRPPNRQMGLLDELDDLQLLCGNICYRAGSQFALP